MKKETLAAIIFGGSLGILMAFLVLFKSADFKLTKNKKIVPTIPSPLVKKVTTEKKEIIPFEIKEPNNELIIERSPVTIKGKATKNSLIVIQSPIKDLVIKNEKEDFSFDLPLSLGENVINMVVYPRGSTITQEKILRIYYLKENL